LSAERKALTFTVRLLSSTMEWAKRARINSLFKHLPLMFKEHQQQAEELGPQFDLFSARP